MICNSGGHVVENVMEDREHYTALSEFPARSHDELSFKPGDVVYVASKRPRLVPWVGAFWMISGLILLPFLIIGPYVN